MPTIEVETNVPLKAFQARFSTAISVWFHRQGVDINHTIIQYRELEASHVSSGPYPFDRFPSRGGIPVHFAFVTCQIAQDRAPQFCTELAQVICRSLQPEIAPDFIFISFRRVDPADFVVGRDVAEKIKEAP